MKKTISSLKDALSYQINSLYEAEKQLQKAIPECLGVITSPALKKEVENYLDSCGDKLLKLERVFNYLMEEPTGRDNEVVEKMIDETHYMLAHAQTNEIRDVLLAFCLQKVNHYKIAGYGTAKAFAIDLDLLTVTELMNEIVGWEKATDEALTHIAVKEVNKKAPQDQLLVK